MKEIGLYLHIPFCRHKCLYCDFNSYEGREQEAARYIAAMLKELELYRNKHNLKYRTVYIGGGTPTVIHYALIRVVMERLQPDLLPGAEVSMECNPGTVTEESLNAYRRMGINRLSIGLQAWQQQLLRDIGRIHDAGTFVKSFGMARKAGFDNINVDLMFALPGQTQGMWEETLRAVAELGPEHLSCYSLKLEEGTRLHAMHQQGSLTLPDEEEDRRMYHSTAEILAGYGYHQYEISNYAREGRACLHNLVYWHNEEYLGLGAGSHSKLDGRRFWNYREPERYAGCVEAGSYPVEDGESISRAEDMWETAFLALRLNEGLSEADFEERYQASVDCIYGAKINKLKVCGLLEKKNGFVRLTAKGRDLSNLVFVELM